MSTTHDELAQPIISPSPSRIVPDSGSPVPAYHRSVLKVNVPVAVTVARKKETVGVITNLVPGSIIAFEKPCDEPLELEVANQRIAAGEAVKVNDKFGLRITAITPQSSH
jgi:flagellar motor switch/type III secretory pathway protein FliN